MATLTIPQPLYLPFALKKTALPFTGIAFNPPKNHLISLYLGPSKPYLLPKVRVSSPITTTFNLLAQSIQSIPTKIISFTPNPSLANIQFLMEFLVSSVGRLFLVALANACQSRRVTTPLTPVAVAISKWLNVYWVILQIRVTLMWFNTPWDRRPFSVIRDLIDPYLSLIRKFSPPLFNMLDVSPFYGAVLLEVLSLVLNANLTANSPYYADLRSGF